LKNVKDNIVYKKAFDFAIKIINVYKNLIDQKRELVLSKQLLRSGTSIGANIREGIEGQSKKDFIAKLSISLKEANESEYWIELLVGTGYLEKAIAEKLLADVSEIIKLLNVILKTARKNLNEVSG
jgi:four helix bundle protein